MMTFKVCLKCAIFVVLFCLVTANDSESFLSKINWDCANNASCVNDVKDDFLKGLQERRSFNFDGLFAIEPVGDQSKPIESEGRGFVSDIFSENALTIPVAGLALRVQRSPEYRDYIEVSLEKPDISEGRRRRPGGLGGVGGVRRGKKYLQTFVPLFLAFNAVGWMLLAVKAVAVLTVKALVVSKFALLVAGVIVFKRLMDSATEKMIASHGLDHGLDHGVVLPYNMDYALPSHNYHTTAELNGNDLFSVQMPSAQEALTAAHGLGGSESLAAESQVNQVVSQLGNASKHQAAVVAGLSMPSVPKVKRQDDIWSGYLKKPMFYNSAAAAATNPMFLYNKA